MNEAETRAEHIDPALKAAGWGVVEGSRIRREYPITLGRIEGHGRRGKPLTADYVLVYRNHKLAVVEAKAWDEAADRRRGPGEKLRRQAGHPLHLLHQRPGHLRHRHDRGHGRRGAAVSHAGRTLEPDLRRSQRLARPLRRRALRGQGRLLPGALLPGHRHRARAGSHRRRASSASCSPWPRARARPSSPFRLPGSCSTAAGISDSREPSRRPRILFLADRNILANQAYNAFSAFPEDAMVRIEPEDIRKKGQGARRTAACSSRSSRRS